MQTMLREDHCVHGINTIREHTDYSQVVYGHLILKSYENFRNGILVMMHVTDYILISLLQISWRVHRKHSNVLTHRSELTSA